MKFIYCDMIDRTYLINVDSICGTEIEVEFSRGKILISFDINAGKTIYELQEDIIYNDDVHYKAFLSVRMIGYITKALYEHIQTKDFIDLNDVVKFAESTMLEAMNISK